MLQRAFFGGGQNSSNGPVYEEEKNPGENAENRISSMSTGSAVFSNALSQAESRGSEVRLKDEKTDQLGNEVTDLSPSNQKQSRLSREEIQEFKIAFGLCTQNEERQECLHQDALSELFMSLGYSLGIHNIQKILLDYPPDPDGYLSLDILLEAYDDWLHEDISKDDEKAYNEIFDLLATDSSKRDSVASKSNMVREKKKVRVVDEVTMKTLLRQVCHDPNINLEIARAVIAEVDRTDFGELDEEDFRRMMRLEL
eukprot:CAMPEP_0182416448 /NCGR_PEP_ID=MMETSP1167-20130531/733_1 /TAXON_ID=2988 /ORGANISM="Mallomonas Sp, Strain CCMP3275" /LENGTH=254 /DNA_ID=CAMNT_0024589197 /DNA_START=86 /DNA_END=850 /DNA_ORIENTATION=+